MENTQGNAPSQDKGAMAQGQQNPPPPYQEVSAMGDAQPAQFPGYSQQAYQNPYPGQPYQGQPYPGQPYPGQPYQGQPYPGQPYQGQPYLGQPYPGQVYPGQVYPGQTVITVQHAPLSPPENDYLVYSIITLLCCCFPLGIAALVFSISVSAFIFNTATKYRFKHIDTY
ncbi:unnamed protein product [Knipowitschia caucasica]